MRKKLNFTLFAATLFLKPALFGLDGGDSLNDRNEEPAVVSSREPFTTIGDDDFRQISSYLNFPELHKTPLLAKKVYNLFVRTQQKWTQAFEFLHQNLSFTELEALIKNTCAKISSDTKADESNGYASTMMPILNEFLTTQDPDKNPAAKLKAIEILRSRGNQSKPFVAQAHLNLARYPKMNGPLRSHNASKAFLNDPKTGPEVASILIDIAGSCEYQPLNAANSLRSMGPDYLENAVEAYLAVTRNRKIWDIDKIKAALEAFLNDPKTGPEVASILIGIASSSTHQSLNAANSLRSMGPDYLENAVQAYLAVMHNPNTDNNEKIRAALTLFKLKPQTGEEVSSCLISIVQNSTSYEYGALYVLSQMGDSWRHSAAQACLAAAHNLDTRLKYDRAKMKNALKAFEYNPQTGPEVASILMDIASSSRLEALEAANSLRNMGPDYLENAVQVYLSVMRNPNNLLARDKIEAALEAFKINPDTKQEAIKILSRYTREGSDDVNKAAIEALAIITGKP